MSVAVGFGGANVSSALGQPLKVEIALVAVSEAEKSGLTARLASPEAFKVAGLDYPYSLAHLKFDIETRGGEYYIKITSKDAVSDPFVSLLVELNWTSGKLLREYTFLLDPPDYKAEQPAPEEIKPIEPVVATALPPPVSAPVAVPEVVAPLATTVAPPVPESAPAAAPPVAEEVVAPAPVAAAVSAPTEAPAAEAPPVAAAPTQATPAAPLRQAEAQPVSAAPVPEEKSLAEKTITVRRGDTLSKIAAQVKEPDVTLEQMLVALYRVNAGKFEGKNMNRIRAGKILRMPAHETFEKLSQTAAVKEIRIQTANWNAYRQKLAAATAPAPEQGAKQEAAGKISTAVADKTPAAKESAKEVLKLSKGEAPGDKTAPGGKAQQQEEAIAKGKAQKESGGRVAMLEKNVQEMQKLVELKGQAPAKPASAVAAASGVAAASAAVAVKPKPVPVAAEPATSMVDEVLNTLSGILGEVSALASGLVSDPMYLGGLAALVVAGGLGFYFVRRRGQGQGRVKKKNLGNLLSKLLPRKK